MDMPGTPVLMCTPGAILAVPSPVYSVRVCVVRVHPKP
jgi:hypothetical protein